MPILVKPRSLGLLTKCERRPPGASLIVSIFGMFDLADPNPDRLEGEQGLWIMAAKELPPGTALDIGMPKPQAEILIGGHAAAPADAPTDRVMLGCALGPMQKHLLVTGDRYWQMTGAGWRPTAPQPFVTMPLSPQRTFGGAGYASNAQGTGYQARRRAMAGEAVALPNIEIPEHAVQSIEATPPTASFGPLALDAKERLQYAGTYDQAWLKSVAPALATDADPRLFLLAPQDQRLSGFLAGNEAYALQNFAADHSRIDGRLPGFRVRCFIGWKDAARGVTELPTRIDTLWLFAGARRGVMIYRAAIGVQSLDGSDVADIMVAYERQDAPARPVDHYLTVRGLRLDPATAARYAFSEHQLAPALSQAEQERRAARRKELAEQRAARQRASMQWVLDQEMARIDLPPALRPTIELPPSDLPSTPEILPEELESGEIDLAEILDSLEATQAKAVSEIDKLTAQYEPVLKNFEKLTDGNAEPGDIDALLAAISNPDAARSIDDSFEHLPPLPPMPPDSDPTAMQDLEDKLARAKNWRGEIVAATGPVIDEQEQFKLAHARFFALPAGRPLEAIRNAVSDDTFTPPDMPALPLPDEARGVESVPPPRLTVDDLVAQIEGPDTPAEVVQQLRTALTDAEAALTKALPALAANGQAPFEVLAAANQPPIATTPEEAVAAVEKETKHALANLRGDLDKADDRLEAGMAAARLASPKPLKPDVPLAPSVGRALGDVVEQEFRRGGTLAGRDLAGADLSGRQFAQADLSGAFLERTKLNGANLTGAKLTGATLAGATLVNTDLSAADLTDANLGEADCRGARFASGTLARTVVLGARMVGASFDQAKLTDLQALKVPMTGATFRAAELHQCFFIQSALDNSVWQNAVLQRTQFVDLSLSGATLAGARLDQTCFLKIVAPQLDFSGAQFEQVSFVGEINLRDARFVHSSANALSFNDADLGDADFALARLNGVYFGKAALPGARFRMTSLKGAILTGNDLRGADFYAANLLEAHLNQTDLTGANLRHANLYGADLMDSALVAADLSNANIGRTILMVPRHVA